MVLELPSPADGVLVKILKKARDSVSSGDVIAQIDTEGKAAAAATFQTGAGGTGPAAFQTGAGHAGRAEDRREKGIDTSKVQGTGRDGRVTKADVLEVKTQRAPLQQPTPP